MGLNLGPPNLKFNKELCCVTNIQNSWLMKFLCCTVLVWPAHILFALVTGCFTTNIFMTQHISFIYFATNFCKSQHLMVFWPFPSHFSHASHLRSLASAPLLSPLCFTTLCFWSDNSSIPLYFVPLFSCSGQATIRVKIVRIVIKTQGLVIQRIYIIQTIPLFRDDNVST